MRTVNTFFILFWADLKKSVRGEVLIYARVAINGQRVDLSTKLKIKESLWDPKLKRARGSSVEARQINQCLDQTKVHLFNCYQELNFKRVLPTAKLLKANYNGTALTGKTLNNILEYHKRKIESTLSVGTIRNFGITEGYVQKFLNQKLHTSDIYLKQLDYKFICDFEEFLHTFWLKGHPKAIGHNTVMKHIQRLHKIITMAFHLEWLDKDPFIRWKSTWEKNEREFLIEAELSNLETYNIPLERLDRVRDLFVFSCYTGISYADIMNLKPTQFKEE